MKNNNKICPNCNQEILKKISFYKNQVDKCDKCKGIWFDYDELRKVKDDKDEFLKWLDIDIWRKKKKLRVFSSTRKCPNCRKNLYEVKYGESNIKVDICNSCKGVWLDHGEFGKIIDYLKKVVNTETLSKYFKHALASSETGDLLIILKLLQYRLCSQYPIINKIIIYRPAWLG
ncbi:MAG: zf-TFIIB domain-containing protein [bacterium]